MILRGYYNRSLKGGWCVFIHYYTRDKLNLGHLISEAIIPIITNLSACIFLLWVVYCIQPIKMSSVVLNTAPNWTQNLSRRYTKKINAAKRMDSWEMLKDLGLCTLQERHERYTVLFILKKIMVYLSPNFGIEFYKNPRAGRHCILPELTIFFIEGANPMLEYSFGVQGAKYFNTMILNIKYLRSVDMEVFKKTSS